MLSGLSKSYSTSFVAFTLFRQIFMRTRPNRSPQSPTLFRKILAKIKNKVTPSSSRPPLTPPRRSQQPAERRNGVDGRGNLYNDQDGSPGSTPSTNAASDFSDVTRVNHPSQLYFPNPRSALPRTTKYQDLSVLLIESQPGSPDKRASSSFDKSLGTSRTIHVREQSR